MHRLYILPHWYVTDGILFHHDFPHNGGAVRSDFQEIDPFGEGGDVDNLFANHKAIAEALGVDFYFAHPYHSWERGANENMNGLIRQYIPKGTSLENIDDEYIEMIQEKLNNRPRKKLGFLTPYEYFFSTFAKINV